MAKPNVINKGELIHFAKQCLVDSGIEKFTLRAVAEKAGVTQGTVYYHFRTKEQILVDIVQDICESSWEEISQVNEGIIKQSLQSAKSRCREDSFFHKLFFSLMVAGFNNPKIKDHLGDILINENMALSENLKKVWSKSPVDGVSDDTWGILFNAIADGLAIQALLNRKFSVDKVYEELEYLFEGFTSMHAEEDNR
ncbi:TetR/AcrR family transcriptional regulator [Cytobacillus solani]|uniref:TetR family transcriptional regulator n=1 Tax=Cytobacillus solani TaxID=1637975 RepID=A0A0Q3RBM7_9BACI|nr:TetR/AcrR family transcriptional regulator [Cytobacillus solani]KOP79414.1 TetR family transcriptional regulator [Bacillus sp. FJAT-21945]KQL27624.1 TetR family transcriptional regulator [Cytobacillus solani]USK55337.1 TetR/AcrR family transcriptional regulator [Cytobacillus solani]